MSVAVFDCSHLHKSCSVFSVSGLYATCKTVVKLTFTVVVAFSRAPHRQENSRLKLLNVNIHLCNSTRNDLIVLVSSSDNRSDLSFAHAILILTYKFNVPFQHKYGYIRDEKYK